MKVLGNPTSNYTKGIAGQMYYNGNNTYGSSWSKSYSYPGEIIKRKAAINPKKDVEV